MKHLQDQRSLKSEAFATALKVCANDLAADGFVRTGDQSFARSGDASAAIDGLRADYLDEVERSQADIANGVLWQGDVHLSWIRRNLYETGWTRRSDYSIRIGLRKYSEGWKRFPSVGSEASVDEGRLGLTCTESVQQD